MEIDKLKEGVLRPVPAVSRWLGRGPIVQHSHLTPVRYFLEHKTYFAVKKHRFIGFDSVALFVCCMTGLAFLTEQKFAPRTFVPPEEVKVDIQYSNNAKTTKTPGGYKLV